MANRDILNGLGSVLSGLSGLAGTGNSIYQTASGQNANNNATQLGIANAPLNVEKEKTNQLLQMLSLDRLKTLKPADYAKIALIGFIIIIIAAIAFKRKS